ncbi:MAG: hypothetical protein ACOX4F_00775 [Atopobiaceae bacterium]|jgi:hypothetical protein
MSQETSHTPKHAANAAHAATPAAPAAEASDADVVVTRPEPERAPEPVTLDQADQFDTLDPSEGAVFDAGSTEDLSRARTTRVSPKIVALIALAAALVVVGIFVGISKLTQTPAQPAEPHEQEQQQVAIDQTITYRNTTYQLVQNGDTWELVSTSQDAPDQSQRGDLLGTPVSLILYNGTFVVPENLADGTWDVAAYTIGSGWSIILDENGQSCAGTGEITSAELAGDKIVLSLDSGQVTVNLA